MDDILVTPTKKASISWSPDDIVPDFLDNFPLIISKSMEKININQVVQSIYTIYGVVKVLYVALSGFRHFCASLGKLGNTQG